MAFLNEKGQAALTDSLFFLVVVSGLCTFLFFFVSNYGQLLDQQLLREYRQEYASSALKTIMYSSVPRLESSSLSGASEIDYLLAFVKEDYADDGLIDESRGRLKDAISQSMAPFNQNSDYIFYIYFPSETEKFGYFLLKLSSRTIDRSKPTDRNVSISNSSMNYFLCKPATLSDVTNKLLTKVGDVSQSNARAKFIRVDADGQEISSSVVQITLAIWVPTELPQITSQLNCTSFTS